MRLEVIVCNICRDVARTTTPYTVTSGDRKNTVDLCDEHGAPFELALEGQADTPKPKSSKAVSASRRTRRGTPIMTLAEIEAAKKKG